MRTFCKQASKQFCICSETVLHVFCAYVHDVLKFCDDVRFWLSHHFKRNIILNDFNKLYGFEHFELNAKTNVLNCFLFNARFLVFKHRCSKTRPTVESFLHSMRIIKFTKYVIAKHTGTLEKHYLKSKCA